MLSALTVTSPDGRKRQDLPPRDGYALRMDRLQLLRRLDLAWIGLRQSYEGLSDADLLEPDVTGRWSVRDIIAHVTTWEEEALAHVPRVLAGERPPRYSVRYGGIDAFNALTTERHRGLALADVLIRRDAVHSRLVRYVAGAAGELLAQHERARRRLRLDTYGHYPKHARAIRAWRERRAAGRTPS
jgi:hypothetical protein